MVVTWGMKTSYARARHVAGEVFNLAGMQPFDGLERLAPASSQDDLVRLLQQMAGDGDADALACAGDDEDFGHGC